MNTQKNRATRRLAASLAVVAAFGMVPKTDAAWVWTGNGADAYWSTADNFVQYADAPGTGAWFRDGYTYGSTAEPIVVSKWDVSFNSKTTFNHANFFVDSGSTLSRPFSFSAIDSANGLSNGSGALSIGADGSAWGDGYLRILSGTYSFKGVRIGQNSDSPTSKGWLSLGSSGGPAFTSAGEMLVNNGELVLNGGTVTVNSGYETYLGKTGGASGSLTLNGGTFVTRRVLKGSTGNSATLTFNGGTLKANMAVQLYGLIASSVTVNVGAKGGTIDTGNLSDETVSGNARIFIAADLGQAGDCGAMTFKGGKVISLEGALNYTGGTTIAAGTTLMVANAAQKDAILGHGLKTLKVIPAVGTHDLVTIAGEGVFTVDDLSRVSLADGTASDSVFGISGDGKSLTVTATSAYVGGTINQSSPTLVFPGKTLADLDACTLRARFQGSAIADDGVEATFFNRAETRDGDDLAKVTYQLQTIDDVYVKSAKVEFTADASGVYAKLVDDNYSSYGNQNAFGTDLSANPGKANYIPYDFRLVEPANAISVSFAHSSGSLDTTSSVRYGAGDYAVPYTSWNNMPVSAGSSAAFGGVTVRQTTTSGQYRCVDLNPAKDLRYGYLDDGDLSVVVDVTDIPYEFYRVVTYHATDRIDIYKFGYVTINGIDYTGTTDATVKGTAAWGASAARNKAKGLREGVNYLVSDLMSGSTVKITGHRDKARSPTCRGCIAAVQIVESTLPTYTATIDDGGEKTFSTLAWDKSLPERFMPDDQIVINVNENTTLNFDCDICVYAIKFNVASGKTLTLVGGDVAAKYVLAVGGTVAVDNDVEAGKVLSAVSSSTVVAVNAGKTLRIVDFSGSGSILNNGTVVKTGDNAAAVTFNNASTGETIVSGGTLKMKGKVGSGRSHAIRVKRGATFDMNGKVDVNVIVRLEKGARFVNSGSAIGNTSAQAVQLTLEGDATVTAGSNFGILGPGYADTLLELGSNTLTLDGAAGFWLSNTTITGDGTIFVEKGTLQCARGDATGENCTLNIGASAELRIDGTMTLCVSNFYNGGCLANGNTFSGKSYGTLKVNGTLTPGNALTNLTLAAGATVKATGAAQVVSGTFAATGACTVDASEITRAQLLSAEGQRIAVLTVPTADKGGTWRVSNPPIAACRAKWFNNDDGTSTLCLSRDDGLIILFR